MGTDCYTCSIVPSVDLPARAHAIAVLTCESRGLHSSDIWQKLSHGFLGLPRPVEVAAPISDWTAAKPEHPYVHQDAATGDTGTGNTLATDNRISEQVNTGSRDGRAPS